MPVLSPPRPIGYGGKPGRLGTGAAPHDWNDSGQSWLARRLESFCVTCLSRLEHGSLTMTHGRREYHFGDSRSDLRAHLRVLDSRFFRHALFGGSLGAAEVYRRGLWTCDDLVALIRILARNRDAMQQLDRGGARLWNALNRIGHWLCRNTRSGSRRNIRAHYDLSNDFFALFLDETMTYSSGIFRHPDVALKDASLAKYDRICRKLDLSPADRVVEIGTGWGGFAIHAATNYGCHVTSTTISEQQYRWAQRRVTEAGLGERVTLLRHDYRDVKGTFDKLVSIEMIEAVGHKFLETFFRNCSRLLRPTGELLLQAITIPDQRYEKYLRSVDFIQRYIFPGGCLPSLGAINQAVGRATDMRITHLEDFGLDYAKTLGHWRRRFHDNVEAIRGLGMTDEFIRTWDYYFAYCEGAFREMQIGVAQIHMRKPDCRRGLLMPALTEN